MLLKRGPRVTSRFNICKIFRKSKNLKRKHHRSVSTLYERIFKFRIPEATRLSKVISKDNFIVIVLDTTVQKVLVRFDKRTMASTLFCFLTKSCCDMHILIFI